MIIIAGEALIDMAPSMLEGKTAYVAHPGGSPYNVAMGIGRLGEQVEFLGRFSTDGFGQLLKSHIAKSHVGLHHAVEGPELTTLALVTPTPSGEFFSFYCQNTADTQLKPADLPAELPGGAMLHFGSISLLLEPTASTLGGLMQREKGQRLISLDPNVRPFLIQDKAAYIKKLEGWLKCADLVKVSEADIRWMYPGQSLGDIAQSWKTHGAALLVVTMGGDGAFAMHGGQLIEVKSPKVKVVDTVGAGDTFMAGLLSWLHFYGLGTRSSLEALSTEQVSQLLSFAAKVAAINCTRAGADPPWKEEL
jgi:fructokinase